MSSIEHNIDIGVGNALRQRRQQLRLALRQLASKSGVSPSMISAIERGAKSPTVSTLYRLADAMAVPLSALIDTHQKMTRIHVARRVKPTKTGRKSKEPRRTSLSADIPGSNFEMLQYTVPARSLAGPFAGHAPGTIEHLHLARGSIRVICGEEKVSLEAGDSCSCYTDVPHSFDNRSGNAEALLYLVVERPADGRRR